MLEENMEVMLNPQYVIDKENKPKAVLLTISEWEQIVEDLEELDDIRAYDAAKAGPQDNIRFEQAVREIEEESK
jgi:PHD/YefM family antitoxin component YafN of YafNO toxin-antitoxin module